MPAIHNISLVSRRYRMLLSFCAVVCTTRRDGACARLLCWTGRGV